jgi:hypothetical protein
MRADAKAPVFSGAFALWRNREEGRKVWCFSFGEYHVIALQ